MTISTISILLAAACLAGALVSVLGEWRRSDPIRSAAKVAASTAFIAIAAINGAAASFYGRAILAALVFSWVGDVLLLSARNSFLTAGIAAFLLSHFSFAAAFMSLAADLTALAAALLIMSAFGAVMLRWLWPHLDKFYGLAVPVYVLAIVVMTSLAAAVSVASGSYAALAAAIIFTVSDIAVARDRFVMRSIVNKAWGLPLYYAAQIVFAVSVLYYR